MIYTGENLTKYLLWKQIIAEAKRVIELAGHDIPLVPDEAGGTHRKAKDNSHEKT